MSLSITTPSILTLSKMILSIMTLSKMTPSINIKVLPTTLKDEFKYAMLIF